MNNSYFIQFWVSAIYCSFFKLQSFTYSFLLWTLCKRVLTFSWTIAKDLASSYLWCHFSHFIPKTCFEPEEEKLGKKALPTTLSRLRMPCRFDEIFEGENILLLSQTFITPSENSFRMHVTLRWPFFIFFPPFFPWFSPFYGIFRDLTAL